MPLVDPYGPSGCMWKPKSESMKYLQHRILLTRKYWTINLFTSLGQWTIKRAVVRGGVVGGGESRTVWAIRTVQTVDPLLLASILLCCFMSMSTVTMVECFIKCMNANQSWMQQYMVLPVQPAVLNAVFKRRMQCPTNGLLFHRPCMYKCFHWKLVKERNNKKQDSRPSRIFEKIAAVAAVTATIQMTQNRNTNQWIRRQLK